MILINIKLTVLFLSVDSLEMGWADCWSGSALGHNPWFWFNHSELK